VLRFDRLKWDSEAWPHRAWFECAASGCVIRHTDKPALLAAGQWIATAGEDGPPEVFGDDDLARWQQRRVPGRVRGFHLWQAVSPFVSWDSVVAEYLTARGNHERMRVFTQQVLGEAWEDRGDAPEAEKLHAQRVVEFRKGQPPHGPVVFTGGVDVQGNRIEWAVWGWSEGMTRWLVDWGVVAGDPNLPETWAEMGRIMAGARYAPGGGPGVDVAAWAVDTGYVSHAVYQFVRGRPRTFGVDGRKGVTAPMIGTPVDVDVRFSGKRIKKGARVWPVGGHALKSNLYAAIRLTMAGPTESGALPSGAMVLPGDVDLAYCEQLTAEHLVRKEMRSGVFVLSWEKLSGRPNEALDIACYARAMAYHLKLDRLTPEQWAALRVEHLGVSAQPDLFDVGAPATPTPREPEPEPPAGPAARGQGSGWLAPKKGWRL
jgi:phage terminase large subunit GpA-like protein